MTALIRRHFKLFFRDPINWVVCILSVTVILSLYYLFIRDFTIKAIIDFQIISDYTVQFVDELMVSGLLIVISAMVALPMITLYVKDRSNDRLRDFLVTPVSSLQILYSYILSAAMISAVFSVMTLLGIVLMSRHQMQWVSILQSAGVLCLSAILCSLLLFWLAMFFKSMTAFTSFSNLFGVMIGFFTGVYIPLGYYPSHIQSALFMTPFTHLAGLIRRIFVHDSMVLMLKEYPVEATMRIEETFGLHAPFLSWRLTISQQVWFILLCAVLLHSMILLMLAIRKRGII